MELITTLVMEDAGERGLLYRLVDSDVADYDEAYEEVRVREFDYLYEYVKHVFNRGTSRLVLVSSENHLANKQFMSDIEANDLCIRRTTRRIKRIQTTLEHPEPLLLTPLPTGDNVDTNNLLHHLQNNISTLTAQRTAYKELHAKYSIIADCTQRKDRALMTKRLQERTLAFDITDLDYLPEDVVNYEILEFIGGDYMEIVRRRCISKKHFAVAREKLSELLWTWTIKDLRAYEKHLFMKYSIYADRLDLFKYRQNKSTIKKGDLIDHMLSGVYKCSFYNFQRDVYCLTRILAEKRREKRMGRR